MTPGTEALGCVAFIGGRWVVVVPLDDAEVIAEVLRDAVYRAGRRAPVKPIGARFLAALEAAKSAAPATSASGPFSGRSLASAAMSRHDVLREELTTDEAARRLGVDARHVRRLCRDDRLRARRIGQRDWAIEASSVDEYRARRVRA